MAALPFFPPLVGSPEKTLGEEIKIRSLKNFAGLKARLCISGLGIQPRQLSKAQYGAIYCYSYIFLNYYNYMYNPQCLFNLLNELILPKPRYKRHILPPPILLPPIFSAAN